jgi:hypothetical protein
MCGLIGCSNVLAGASAGVPDRYTHQELGTRPFICLDYSHFLIKQGIAGRPSGEGELRRRLSSPLSAFFGKNFPRHVVVITAISSKMSSLKPSSRIDDGRDFGVDRRTRETSGSICS